METFHLAESATSPYAATISVHERSPISSQDTTKKL